ncbi:MAG TPA: SUMF1/EgtB/PvdO family nonheme iron enzyme [Verrucomicrobiota bacterium]|nr:SUMF1/EgtB/PvdO family nonheme iron enzyme [Verrucomicrobiota bacterium]
MTLAEKMVRFSRPGLVEEYTVSADGVRQDFLVATPPPDAGDLRVTLAASGARVEATPFGARLVLEGSGRKIAYSRLRVTDATGRELPARFDVTAPGHNAGDDGREDGGALPTRRCGELAILVNDANAVYPIRIDPTFSDENWISIIPSVPGVGGEVYAAAMDTAGNLYIGGSFISAGSVVANRIAKWDGSSWSALGSGMNNRVWALAVSGSDLYAGGYFTTAGGVSANCVARWNGSSWSALGSGMGGLVYALAVSGSDLYAGGTFTTAGGVAANRIAKWDGSDWSALGSGMNDWVGALAVSGSDLYAGGGFGTAGGVSAQNIAKWNGSSWSPLGSGMNDCVRALAVSGSDLYVGGDFSTAGGVSANYVAKWDGSSWSPLGTGMNDWVGALAVSGSDLYAGGTFTTAGGVEANRIAKWNGSSWSALGLGMVGGVYALAVSGSDLYVGGNFTKVGGVSANYVAKWNGSSWSALGSGMNGGVSALAVSGNDLYAGGSFTMAGGVEANRIAKWNGSSWSMLGSGMDGPVYSLAVSGSDLYAGGYFRTAGGVAANRVAKWNGSGWSALGWGLDSYVSALVVSGDDLYAGGGFWGRVSRWDGSSWTALGSGVDGYVYALAVSGSDLYAGGNFTAAGGVSAKYIARWDGSSWTALGSGVDGYVYALAVSGTDLYAGGWFTTAGGVAANYVAKWDGSIWNDLGSGMNYIVSALAVAGSDLYAGGDFTTAGGVSANYVAKWNGSSWNALGSGMNGTVRALAVSGSDLYAGGTFSLAGGKVSAYVAKADLSAPSVSFDDNSDVLTNPWLGLYQVGDSYSFAGTGSFAGATRSYSIIGRETVLGVKCLVLHVVGQGTGAEATQYTTVRVAQDTVGNLQVLKITGTESGGEVISWTADAVSQAALLIPSVPQAGQSWLWPEGGRHEVVALNQTVPQLSTGLGPYSNCVQLRRGTDDSWLASGVGVVKEVWNDDGQLNGWERTTSSSVVFDANSDVFTNPWLGLYQVGDSYSFAGTGTFTGATRTWSIIGQETVLGVKCLVLRIHGHGKGSYANEYYDVRVAQDTNGNLRFLRVTGWEPAGGALDSTVSTPASARMLFPATVQVGQRWLMFDQQSDVMAVGQTVPQLSTGFGPTPNCVHVRAVSNDGDVDESWWGAGVGVVKEVWNDSGQLNGWERITSSSVVFDANSDVFTNPWLGLYQVGDSYSLAGTGTFAGASRSWSIIGRETVLGVKCLVLRVLGHGTGANANEYYDVRLAQDTQGDLRALKVAGWKPSGPIETWTAASPAQAVLWYPMNFQVGQMWTWFEEQHQVLALSQTLPQLSTGFGPTSNCVHVRTTYDGGADVDEFWLAPGVGSVKEAWNDSGQLNGWERITSSSVVFDANSDVFTNPWLGLYQVGDSYSLAGTGTFAGASRSWSIIGRETVLGVKCLVLRVLGHGTGANANEYYDVRLAQDTQGDLRALKVAGWKPSGPIETWTAASPAQAVLWYPMNFQVGQMWTWFEEQHQVLALSQTLPQLSTGFGPTSNCVHVRTTYDGGADVDEFWLAPGVGSVKEAWNDSGQLNGWERVPDFGFASWTVQTGLPGDRRGPTDRNGPLDLPNLLAYALGVNPMTAQPEDLPTGSLHDAGGQEQFHFIYRKSKTAMGIEMRVVGALSLEAADWQPVTATPVKVGDTPDGLAELWQVTIPVDVPQRFLRLAVLPRGVSPAPAGMVLIPTGTFTMGDTFNEGESRERPVHSVYVSAFYMDKFAVTEALWDEVRVWANANGYDLGTVGAGRAADHPVHSVNWYDAVKWCNARSEREGRIPAYYTSAGQTTVYQSGQVDVQNDWVKWDAGYRLPTDAEWEKAARGGLEGNRFPWGDTIQHSRANYNSTMSYTYDTSPTRGYHPTFATGGEPYTSPVGYFAPNGYGLYDMAGNVWEWCWDWYSTSYYGVSPAADPRGPTSGSIRVERGGCWGDGTGALFSRCASRSGRIVLYRGHFLGFRSVLGSGQP